MYLRYLDGLQVTLGDVVLHCKRVFEEVRSKTFRHDGLFATFNSTLNRQALTEWQAVYNAIPDGTALDLAQLEQSIKALIVAFAVDADRHALLQYLRQGFPKKPKRITVQVLVTLFQQLINVADWLPGHMPMLTEEELKQAYHDQMPSSWTERLAATGCTVPGEMLQLLRIYFGQQETLAKRLEDANNAQQSRSAMRRRRRDDAADDPHQGLQPRRRRRSRHNCKDRRTPTQGQRQAQAPEARHGKIPPVEPPASALWIMLRAPFTLVPGTHGASAVKMHETVPTTTTTATMLKEQAADSATADNSHHREAKRKASSWRPSTARWSRKTYPNYKEDLQRSPTLLPWSSTKKNSSLLMSRLPV